MCITNLDGSSIREGRVGESGDTSPMANSYSLPSSYDENKKITPRDILNWCHEGPTMELGEMRAKKLRNGLRLNKREIEERSKW